MIMDCNYKNVQFFLWKINTSFRKDSTIADSLVEDATDLEKRLDYVQNVIDIVTQDKQCEPNALKVFVAPEFLLRKDGSAYNFPVPQNSKLIALLKKLEDIKYNDWLFVLGTFVGYWDNSLHNSSIVKVGGETGYYIVDKQSVSNLDFPENSRFRESHLYCKTEGGKDISENELGLSIGIEICSDHTNGTLMYNDLQLDIHIVISCGLGAETKENLCFNKSKISYAVICDGVDDINKVYENSKLLYSTNTINSCKAFKKIELPKEENELWKGGLGYVQITPALSLVP